MLKKNSDRKNDIQYQIQVAQEKYNILTEQYSQAQRNNAALKAKITRYEDLKKLVERINESLNLDEVASNLVQSAFSIVVNNNGVCLLYLIDKHTQTLKLFKAKKEKNNLVIKTKEGDVFDLWVLRHNRPLMIEDIRKDFRFDLAKIRLDDLRSFLSLISSPFISERRFLGILRLDHRDANFYSQDDLRLLVTIADLGAVALETSELFQETQRLAIHDGLTQVFTKQYFLERLKEECARSNVLKSSLSLLMLDIDYFKKYNDRYGHTVGDIVLKKISNDITAHLKKYNPIVGRFGGEEFIIILPGMKKNVASKKADRLRKKIEQEKIMLRRKKTSVTVSIGVSGLPEDSQDIDDLIMKTDKAMYEAKRKGRNRVCCS